MGPDAVEERAEIAHTLERPDEPLADLRAYYDETTYSREIAPLAGFYPSVYVGAPWWFLDTPTAITRFRAAATAICGERPSGLCHHCQVFEWGQSQRF